MEARLDIDIRNQNANVLDQINSLVITIPFLESTRNKHIELGKQYLQLLDCLERCTEAELEAVKEQHLNFLQRPVSGLHTLLHSACATGHIRVAMWLIDAEIINAQANNYLGSCLVHAVIDGQFTLVKGLIAKYPEFQKNIYAENLLSVAIQVYSMIHFSLPRTPEENKPALRQMLKELEEDFFSYLLEQGAGINVDISLVQFRIEQGVFIGSKLFAGDDYSHLILNAQQLHEALLAGKDLNVQALNYAIAYHIEKLSVQQTLTSFAQSSSCSDQTVMPENKELEAQIKVLKDAQKVLTAHSLKLLALNSMFTHLQPQQTVLPPQLKEEYAEFYARMGK